ncbi:MAG: hypothetical protein KatS3mg059_1124 [Thermomicrobiales bacterium]|nr:MAG: hypothetical protein KatS3mg059_1124 [Thermomicrobiales bacterium]
MERTWEYRITVGLDEAALNALGAEGWELVAVTGDTLGTDSPTLFFKRPGLSFRERVTIDQKQRYFSAWGLGAAESGSGERP